MINLNDSNADLLISRTVGDSSKIQLSNKILEMVREYHLAGDLLRDPWVSVPSEYDQIKS